MTTPQAAGPPAKTIRLIHAAMVTGVLLLAAVGHFVLRPTMANSGDLPPSMLRTFLGVALGACALSLVLRRRVPQRSTDESVDLYWTKAASPALLTWAPLEAASLLAIYLYARTGAQSTIAVAAVAVLLFVALNPARFERS
jgi:hypothetical protein